MTEKSKTWRSSTTTRSWSTSRTFTDEQRADIDALLDAGLHGGKVHVSEQWRYSGDNEDGPFQVEIKDGAVTVNGQHYDSIDEVPRAQRERIEALRGGLADGGLWDMLQQAGVDIGGLAGTATRGTEKPEFIMETDIPDVRSAAPASEPAATDARPMDTQAPGAVPRGGGGLRRIVLVVVAVGLAWWILRLTGAA